MRPTKGSQARRDAGLGGVLLDARGQPLKFFSLELTKDQRKALGEGCISSIIFEAELCAAILAMVLWKDVLCGRPVVAYIDNNSVRDVLISGSARNRMAIALTKLYLTVESLSRSYPGSLESQAHPTMPMSIRAS